MNMLWSAVAGLLIAVAAGAAEPGSGARVADVKVRNLGTRPLDAGYVLAQVGIKAGQAYDPQAVSRDVKALLSTGRFGDVRPELETLADGKVQLTFAVAPKLVLNRAVVIQGADSMRESKIRDLLALNPGDPVDDALVAVRTQKVIEEYRKKYYPDVRITWTIEEGNRQDGYAGLTVTIREGGRAPVREVVYVGNDHIPASTLRKAMKQPAWWNPFWWLRKHRYEEEELEEARQGIAEIYQNDGYLDVVVPAPVVERTEDDGLKVTVTVKEGPRYRVGTLNLERATLFPEAALRPQLVLKPGDTASMGAIGASAQTLRDYYGSRGYVDTVVKPVFEPDPARGVVNIRFVLAEGKLTYIRNILIEGNERTRDKVIRRELLVRPGDIYDEVKVRRSERIVSNLGYFSEVRASPLSTSELNLRDLVFDVEEKRTGNLAIGGGFSSVDNVMGFLEVSQGNFDLLGWPYFTGGGQKLRLRANVGSTRKEYDLSFTEPWFMDRKLSLGFDLYRSDVNYSEYDVKRTGVSVALGRALPHSNRIEYRYRLENKKLTDVTDTNIYHYVDDPTQTYSFQTENEDLTESSFTLTLAHDTRDNPFIPTRGNRTAVSGSVSGGPLGFDLDLYNVSLNSVQYVPLWFRHVLMMRTRWEVVDAYGNTDEVPISERLFIGGGRTLRGFDYRDVGPKVFRVDASLGGATTYHKPIGGQSLALASLEYTIPVVSVIRVAGFYDVGNVWEDAYEFDLDVLASSMGLGLRLDIPYFPVRIDRGWVIEKDSVLTDSDSWVFWIGHDF